MMSRTYATLVTRPSYLAGAVILAFSLRKHGSQYPLLVIYTQSLTELCVSVLKSECSNLNIVLREVNSLQPPNADSNVLIAQRFQDTWTKLRVFQPEVSNCEEVCFLDADIMIRKNMDDIFNTKLPGENWVAAAHACVCNLDNDPWAPVNWVPENCAYTGQINPHATTEAAVVPPPGLGKETHRLFNSGVILLKPSPTIWKKMISNLESSNKVSKYIFPDQDFLNDFFADHWISLCWQYNAIKTMKYWHPEIWSEISIVALHFIVDKPWASMQRKDGIAGYLGKDGETHDWWWQEFRAWMERAPTGVASIMEKFVASETKDNEQMLGPIGSDVQAFANNRSRLL